MRTLLPAPASALDPSTGEPRWGSYRGAVPRIDLDALAPRRLGRLGRFARQKRWMYGALSTDALFVGFCIVDLGYAISAFAYAFDRATARLVVDRSVLAPPAFGAVRQTERLQYNARCDHPAGVFRVERWRGRPEMTVDLKVPGLEVHASLMCEVPPPSVTAIVPIEPGGANVTEKRALLPLRGSAVVQGQRHALGGGFGSYDYTHGLLARHTTWRWAFLLGRAQDGTPCAVNLVRGFVGEPECAVWAGDEVYPLGEGHIEFDAARPQDPWTVTSEDGAVELTMTPGGAHSEAKDLGIVSSRFVQPVGLYRGTVRLPGRRELVIDGVPGVTEDQDVRW